MVKKGIMESTAMQVLLSFLSDNPGTYFMPAEIMKHTRLSRRAFFLAIKELILPGYAVTESKGRLTQYAVDHKNPFVKQFKISKNIEGLGELLKKLEPMTYKVILFGSASRGEDSKDSDLDLFVVTQSPDTAALIIKQFKSLRKIQAIIKTPSEIPDFSEKEKVFYAEVQKGIVLREQI
jgi:predicted nucleotidyltransferase